MKEIWKPIVGYEKHYEVSNYGNIRSICSRWGIRNKPRMVSQVLSPKGYKRVRLCKNNTSKFHMVHRLVAEAFIGKPKENKEINHKDYNRANNSINNLEWISHLNNVKYSKGKKVLQYDLRNNFIKEWQSTREIEKEIGIDHRQVGDCCNKKEKTCHGFIFKYKEEK